ncbi:MAG: hypothetical protein QOG85_822 [Gaiellaceae bacterium]|jgi:hypothetical protein|nr:hypothetical protein [Gaiellaceae bacterium]
MDLKNKTVVVLCANYIYEGVLEDLTHDVVTLREPRIVYVTGPWEEVRREGSGRKGAAEVQWRRAERIPVKLLRIERCAVEAMGELSI